MMILDSGLHILDSNAKFRLQICYMLFIWGLKLNNAYRSI